MDFGAIPNWQNSRGTAMSRRAENPAKVHENAVWSRSWRRDPDAGSGLLELIAQRAPEQQARLLEVAYEGEYWKPTCASCGVKMAERTPKNGGAAFWGCVNFPRCKRTLAMTNVNV
jgi:Topoisomerase DNA binding C4 zinc finger